MIRKNTIIDPRSAQTAYSKMSNERLLTEYKRRCGPSPMALECELITRFEKLTVAAEQTHIPQK